MVLVQAIQGGEGACARWSGVFSATGKEYSLFVCLFAVELPKYVRVVPTCSLIRSVCTLKSLLPRIQMASVPLKAVTDEGDVAQLTYDVLEMAEVTKFIKSDQAGALVVWAGTTRDSFQGRYSIWVHRALFGAH